LPAGCPGNASNMFHNGLKDKIDIHVLNPGVQLKKRSG